jgi:ribosomal protein S19E (S16A)
MSGYWAGSRIAKGYALHKIKKAGAVSPGTAKQPDEIGIQESYLKKLEKLGLVKRTEDGRYYVYAK